MMIAVSREVAAMGDVATHNCLDRILVKIEDGWHIWDVTGDEHYESTGWVADRGTRGTWVTELYILAVRRSGWAARNVHGRRIHVALGSGAGATLSSGEPEVHDAQAAAWLAEQPLVLLVENREADFKRFLRRLMEELDRGLARYFWPPSDRARSDSTGGKGQMLQAVEDLCRDKPARPRLVVVVDSDRHDPTSPPSAEAEQLRRACRQYGVACWVLAKREAENYLPHALLAKAPNRGAAHATAVVAWERMSEEQKDHYDLRNGLPAGGGGAADLFADLAASDRQLLQHGFGPKIDECWELRDSQTKLDVAAELRQRGGGDLEVGLALIRREV